MLSRESDYSGVIQLNIKGWDLPDIDTTFIEYNSQVSYNVAILNDLATINVNLIQQQPYLFILSSFVGVEEGSNEYNQDYFQLFQNHPNPFVLSTEISYFLPRSGYVELIVYNVLGQNVKTLVFNNQEAGYNLVIWDGHDKKGNKVAAGVYFYELNFENYNCKNKLIVTR